MRTKTLQRPERKDAGGGREVRSFALQIKAAGDDGTVEGYGSVFGVRDNYGNTLTGLIYRLPQAITDYPYYGLLLIHRILVIVLM